VGRRPYTFEATGKLIVGLAPELLLAAVHGAIVPTTSVYCNATGGAAISLGLSSRSLATADNVLSFSLAKLPPTMDCVATLSVTAKYSSASGTGGVPVSGKGMLTTHTIVVRKTRRLVRVPLPPGQEAVVVDHHTRGLSVIKPSRGTTGGGRVAKPWLGTGWFVYSGFNCKGQSQAPSMDWSNGDNPGNFTDVVNDLARRGFTQLMIYDLETIVCGGDPATTLLPVLDLVADVGMRVLVTVKDRLAATVATPSSESFSTLAAIVRLVRNHRALLGYYICDDCCPGGDAGGDEYMRNFTKGYANLKKLDPYHPAFGALECPRSWEFLDGPGGRDGRPQGSGYGTAHEHPWIEADPNPTLRLDVVMHENYDVNFAGHAGKGPRAPIEAPEGDAPLRRYPTEYEPLINCPWGEGSQYYLYAPAVEGGKGPMGGVGISPMSPNGLRGIGWLGTANDMHDVLWYTYNKIGSASPSASSRLSEAASQLAFEMQDSHERHCLRRPSL
jgi:hypothetical protein